MRASGRFRSHARLALAGACDTQRVDFRLDSRGLAAGGRQRRSHGQTAQKPSDSMPSDTLITLQSGERAALESSIPREESCAGRDGMGIDHEVGEDAVAASVSQRPIGHAALAALIPGSATSPSPGTPAETALPEKQGCRRREHAGRRRAVGKGGRRGAGSPSVFARRRP